MTRFPTLAVLTAGLLAVSLQAQDPLARARDLEAGGNPLSARSLLEQTVKDDPSDVSAAAVWAEVEPSHLVMCHLFPECSP